MKKVPVYLLAVILMFLSSARINAYAASGSEEGEIMPYYNNTASALSVASVSDSGVITITNKYTGFKNSTTKAVIKTYIEKNVSGYWQRVDINQTNNQWVDTIYNFMYTGSHTFQLPSRGSYRIKVEFTIYGTGGAADVINCELHKTY